MDASSLVKYADLAGTATLIRGGPCVLTAARIHTETAAADVYLQLFDAASTSGITLGTTQPDWVIMLDSGTGTVSGGDGLPSSGLAIRNGLVGACTTTATGSTGSTAQVRLAII